ncbi:MAG: hypothetical protein AAFX06_14940 [Planctomycetota bacterium]
MPGQFRAARRTFKSASAIDQHLRVKVDADGRVSLAGAADPDVGNAARPAYAENEDIGVDLVSLEGTVLCIAAVAITAGDAIYGAANGRVNTTNTGAKVGIALHNAAVGAQVEVLRRPL